MDQKLLGKRKKRIGSCPNPLFEQWLLEWKTEAAEKGLKSQHTYAKALNNLRKYPAVFTSGKECRILQNFGDKICQMLDEKLAAHKAEYANFDGNDNDSLGLSPTPPKRKKHASVTGSPLSRNNSNTQGPSSEKRQRIPSGSREYIPQYRSGPYAIILTLYQKIQEPGCSGLMNKKDLMEAAQPLADKSFTVPDPGCRYTAWSSMGTLINKGLVNKFSCPAKYRLTEAGCELALRLQRADQSMSLTPADKLAVGITVPIPNNNVLVSGYGNGKGSPSNTNSIPQLPSMGNGRSSDMVRSVHSISLLESSDEEDLGLLERLKEKTRTSHSSLSGSLSGSLKNSLSESGVSVLSHKPKPSSFEFSSDEEELKLPMVESSSQDGNAASDGFQLTPPVISDCDIVDSHGSNSGLHFWYVGDGETLVRDKDRALVTVDDNIGVGFLVKVDYEKLLFSDKKYVIDTTRANIANDVFAYLSNDDAPVMARTPVEHVAVNPRYSSTNDLPSLKLSEKCTTQLSLNNNYVPTDSSEARPSTTNGTCSVSVKGRAMKSPILQRGLAKADSVLKRAGLPVEEFSRPVILSPASVRLKSTSENSQGSESASQSSLTFAQITLPARTFSVMLIVDNNEIYGSGKGKEQLLQELKKNSVPLEVRKLQVGDFCWVARSKINPLDELVLHEIVERKRMDDLASSIVDGRFKEQKFRLRNCGLKKPIYLVEDYGSMKHFSINEDALKQAIVNTQVIDQFFVKRTADIKESAAYLTIMTRFLQAKYLSKTLQSCGKKELDRISTKDAIKPDEATLLTFDEFDKLSVKTRALTVQEMFGKQLVQIRGITPEKAAVIVNTYPTPSRLVDAYNTCSSTKAKESLLANLKFGNTQRNIGPAISKAVFLLYTSDVLL